MGTPRIMLRFRDEINAAIAEHNAIFEKEGRVYWGLWLKSFENKKEIAKKLEALSHEPIYIADTQSKAKPSIYICDVRKVILKSKEIKASLVPHYYRKKRNEVPIWFELGSKIQQIDADERLHHLLGVTTIYFLTYDEEGAIINDAPQREYSLSAVKGATYVLHLSDIHLGEDHAFSYPVAKDKTDISSKHTLSEVIEKDLKAVGVFGKVGCVVISGDIVTKGAWEKKIDVGGRSMSGLELAGLFMEDLSKKIQVSRNLFCMVPGNHDIVREARGDAGKVQKFLLHYNHEAGFRSLREECSEIYKLSPLNYVVRIDFASKTLVLGLLNSAYLNEKAVFSEYGYVGDDADTVFSILESIEGASKNSSFFGPVRVCCLTA